MHPLIEKVARAICWNNAGGEEAMPWDRSSTQIYLDGNFQRYVSDANVAIHMVLTFEPTPVMCHAAYKDRGDVEWGSDSQWRAMTAALLKEIENG